MKDTSSTLCVEGATKILTQHFHSVSGEEFSDRVTRHFRESAGREVKPKMNQQDDEGQLTLPLTVSCPMPLDAYLACALTGLGQNERDLIFQLSDAISEICKKFAINLYEPRKKTDPVYHSDVPDSQVFKLDRERVLRSDLLIHLSHFPSTGSGEELDFAYSALVPIIVVSRSDDRVSRMITGIPSLTIHIEYTEPEDLRRLLEECLLKIRPILVERKIAFAEFETNIVGDRIRSIRQSLRLTRDDVCDVIPGMTVEALAQLEDQVDRVANPTLVQLRQLATVLKTTVADLVEPSLSDTIVSHLSDWLEGRQAARHGFSEGDRNKIIRRILLRVIDSLE